MKLILATFLFIASSAFASNATINPVSFDDDPHLPVATDVWDSAWIE